MNKNLRIGKFIAEKLVISGDVLKEFLNMQEYLHEKIGEIAVREKYINKEEQVKILTFQKKHQVSFGNASLYLGLMKNLQIKYLLDIQAQNKHRLGELLVEQGIVTQKKLLKILDEFYSMKQSQFTILTLMRDFLYKDVQQIVKEYNYRLHEFSDKEKMLSQIEKLNPQLIFLDQEMKKSMEFALEIKQAFPSRPLKIALFSEGKQKLEVISGYEYGIDYILPVPFTGKHLINILIDTEVQTGKKQKERVLIVDDSPVVRHSVARELTGSGFQTLFAENGKQAVEIAALEQPDLIIMDINMPVMDGYQACLKLKDQEKTRQIPIIILTTNNTREEREKGFEVGAIEYFTKPFTKGHLSSYIRHLLSDNKKIRPERILIAEDSMICREIYKSIFNKYGFRYELAENGQELLDILDKGFEPSAILLDYYMPVLDGFQTCARLKEDENYRHIPIIMVTVAKKKEDILKGLKAGANDYIAKPFEADELVARIEAHIKSFSLFKKLQEQYKLLQEKDDALVRANEEIKSFTNIVTHDLRAPLVNLKGFSHELKSVCEDIYKILKEVSPHFTEDQQKRIKNLCQEEMPEALGFIDSSTSTMDSLVSNILTLSRIGRRTLHFEEIKIDKLVEEKLKTLHHQIESKGIKINLDGLPTVTADELALEQIFGNILSNAIIYLDQDRPGEIEISGEKRENDTLFSVKDNGRGIATEDFHKIFELFRRAGKPDVPGEGMGLPYAKTLVERHGGEIWFESQERVGTTFYFTISDKLA